MARKPKNNFRPAVFDFETDPFEYGEVPEPFSVGFYDGETYWEYWGDDCVEKFFEFLEGLDQEYRLYAHNGGKFDFFFLMEQRALEQPIKIINGRIVQAKLGKHELRDSYSILPIPLVAYQKDDIDYQLFKRGVRENHKDDILHYQAKDCEYLYELVMGFLGKFGPKLTIGSAAIKELTKLHSFPTAGEAHDKTFRQFYFGGRVQAFKSGEIIGDHKVYDVNSMYPAVMSSKFHPVGTSANYVHILSDFARHVDPSGYFIDDRDRPYFIRVTGINHGALCRRDPDTGGLDFQCGHGEFYTTSHELQTALKYSVFEIEEIHEMYVPMEKIKFDAFVDKYVAGKIAAQECGDKVEVLLNKLILNSSYGKTAQNPENFFEYLIQRPCIDPIPDLGEWEPDTIHRLFTIWRKPSPVPRYFDVAIGASITGAARAVMLEALCTAKNPLYCDTDSVICEALPGMDLHSSRLGAWDLEAEGEHLYIGGKKLYALFAENNTQLVKKASKGARLSGEEIRSISKGNILEWKNDAPSFKRDGSVKFISRNIKSNVASVAPFGKITTVA